MRRNVLIAKCAAGEIKGDEYAELCNQFPWLKKNVEAVKAGIEPKPLPLPRRTYKRQGDK